MAFAVPPLPSLIVGLLLGALETLPAVYYGRSLAAEEPVLALFSFAVSFAGTAATYLLLFSLAVRRRWLGWTVSVGIALASVVLQLSCFGIYREFASPPTVSVADFVRQNSRYACALFLDRLGAPALAVSLGAALAVHRVVRRGVVPGSGVRRGAMLVVGCVVLISHGLARPPFMSLSQHAAWLIARSMNGPGVLNGNWTPDRARPASGPAQTPMNIILFRLEEIAALATTLARPELSTTPFLKSLVAQHPDEAFVADTHFSNATATDVSVLSIYTGLAPAAPLEAHRHVPLLWDYFFAAGYDTSLFLPDHLEWGDFRILERSRAMAAQLLELARIQQKYAGGGEGDGRVGL